MSTSKIFLWNTVLNLIAAPLRFSLNLYLASCLLPKDYGAMVIPAVIVGVSTILIDSGLKSSLIQKSTLKIDHSSTIFFVNILVSIVLCLLFLIISYPLELFFKIEDLALLISLASASLIIRSLSMVNEARLQIKGKYGQLISVELFSYILAYGLAIYLAKHNYGPFSLAALAITSAFFYSVSLFFLEGFIPRYRLVSKKLLWLHWRMGKSLLGQGLLEAFSDKVDEVILGRFIGVSKLGLYSKGREYSNTLGTIGSKFFARPWFSVMSKFSTNKEFFIRRYKLAFLILVTGGVFMIGVNYYFGAAFIRKIMGEQWISLTPLFQYFIVSTALYYLVTFNKYTILALGKSIINFRIEIYYSAFRLVALIGIFLLFNKSDILVFLLISLDILSRILLVIIQNTALDNMLNLKLGLFGIIYTILMISQSVVSIVGFGSLAYVSILTIVLIFLFFQITVHARINLKK